MQEPDYSISTPENVDLHLEIAGIGNRLIAQAVDLAIIASVNLLIILGSLVMGYYMSTIMSDPKARTIAIGIFAMLIILAVFFIQAAYFLFFEGAWHGQTPGKRLAGIRVIEINGQPIGWTASLIRNLVRMLDNFMFLGLLVVIFNKNERRVGDLAAGTLVVRERQANLAASEIKTASHVHGDDRLDIGRITPEEYDILTEFLKRRKILDKIHRPQLAKRLAEHFADKLQNSDHLGVQENPENYLESIFLTYQARAQSL